MNIKQYSIRRDQAYKEWKTYIKGVKDNPKDIFLKDMKAVYNQLKSGRKVIDFYKVFDAAGIHNKWEPRIAIAPANLRIVYCSYYKNGEVVFKAESESWRRNPFMTIKADPLPNEYFGQYEYAKELKTPVPKIPASLRPKGDLSRYWILWEVEKWETIPKDPYLLKRLTKNIFVILAGWDLTELERSVIAGRAW